MSSRIYREGDITFAALVWEGGQRPVALSPRVATDPPEITPNPQELKVSMEQQLRQAFEAGLHEGAARCRKDTEAETRACIEKLVDAIRDLAGARNDAIRQAEADIVRLSIEVARRILHREISLDPSAIEALIRAALDKLRAEEIQRVRVHPELVEVVRDCMKRTGRSPDIEIIGDPGQPRGGALFEISRGSLDASIDMQLKEIERGLADTLGERA